MQLNNDFVEYREDSKPQSVHQIEDNLGKRLLSI